MSKVHSGFNENTSKNLLLDAGAIYVNYDLEVDTFATAGEKLLGATSGGNQFNAIPEFRTVEVDGVRGE